MALEGYLAIYRHCSPRLISFYDTAIVRNFYPKKFHPLCTSKKLSKDLMGICIWPLFWLLNRARPVLKHIIDMMTWQFNSRGNKPCKYYWSFTLPLSCESWFKSCEHRRWGLNHNFQSFEREKGGLIFMIMIVMMMIMIMIKGWQWWWWW